MPDPLNPSGRPPTVQPVAGFDMTLGGAHWPFLDTHADGIARHWAARSAANPALFDGRVLIAREAEVNADVVRGGFVEAPFSALLYWRHLGFPLAGAFNCFGAAAVRSRDGAVLLGVMAPDTANAGRLYFPCGTPDREDVAGTKVDIDGSLLRELKEETGLGADLVRPTAQHWLVRDGALACCARLVEVGLDADALARRVRGHLAAEASPELADVAMVRRVADLDGVPVMAFARALLERLLPP